MALQTSGPISLKNIADEFGDTAPHSLTEFYSAGTGIPSSGAISLTQFYGLSSVVPLYLRSGSASSMAISPDKSRIAYFTAQTTTTMTVYVFNTSDFSLVYAKTATLHLITATGSVGIYSTAGAFDSSNNLFLARGTFNGGNGISFVLYNSIGTLVASRSISNTSTNGVSTAFYANGFFYTAGRINNGGRLIKRSSSTLALSAELLKTGRRVNASFVASEDRAYSVIDEYQSINNVAVTTLSNNSTVYKKQTPAPQYNTTYVEAIPGGASYSRMAGNYLIEERMEGDYVVESGFRGPTTEGLTNPKPYTFITNISSTNTVVSCYAIYHDSLAALKQSTQIAGTWPSSPSPSLWTNRSLVSELRDNLIVIFGNDYFWDNGAGTYAYTGVHITIFNTSTNQVIASAITPSSSTAMSVLDVVGISFGGSQRYSPTLQITNEYLYLGKYITQTPQSSSALVTSLNAIGGGITWTSATTTVSSASVSTTSPTLNVQTSSGTERTYTSGITAYTPTPSIIEYIP